LFYFLLKRLTLDLIISADKEFLHGTVSQVRKYISRLVFDRAGMGPVIVYIKHIKIVEDIPEVRGVLVPA